MNWKGEGTAGVWSARLYSDFNPGEKKEYKRRVAADRASAEAEQKKCWAKAAKIAQWVWDHSKPAPEKHAYLCRKEVSPFKIRIAHDGRLVVPVFGDGGEIQSIQFISENGTKRFLTGGKTAGGMYPIPSAGGLNDGGPVIVCEGFATAASLHMATGFTVVSTFSCGNIRNISKVFRGKFQNRIIIIAADNDCTDKDGNPREMNPGVDAATKAAAAIGGKLAICPEINGRSADFNDLHREKGLDIVREAIEASIKKNESSMPEGFFLRTDGPKAGLYKLENKPDGDTNEIRLGPPLFVRGFTRDADGNSWGLWVEWNDADDHIHHWAMPLRMLNEQGGAWYGELLDGGWRGVPGTRTKLAIFLASVQPEKKIRCVERTGWHDGAFVLPDATFGAAEGELVLQSPLYVGLYKVSGTLEEWRTEVARLAIGNTRLTFCICVALAGVLLRLAEMEGGGFHLEGPSSAGKTTGLRIGASVWGDTSHLRSWRQTDNALESVCSIHNDTTLFLDEVGQSDAKTLSESAYMIANGAGKGRASRDGSARKAASWLLLFVSSGELSLADKMSEIGRKPRAGQEIRIAGIPTDKTNIQNLHDLPDASALVNKIKETSSRYYGSAGRAFLKFVIANMEQLKTDLKQALDIAVGKLCPPEADAQVQRVARRFALCAIAGGIAQQAGILPADFDAAGAVKACFNSWLDSRGGAGASEDAAILAAVRLFVEQNGASRFQDMEKPDAVCVNRVGFRRQDEQTTYYVLPESFKEVCRGFSVDRSARVLRDAGVLVPEGDRLKSRSPELPGLGRVRCYVLRYQDN